MMRNATITALLTLAAALGFASCQSPTPATRIQENPALYEALPAKDKALVMQGQIREGMSPQAVYLAWGQPDSQPFVGQDKGKRLTRWVYSTLEPVFIDRPYCGWHHCGPYGGYWCGGGIDTAYVRRPSAYVLFENDKVVSWEAQQGY